MSKLAFVLVSLLTTILFVDDKGATGAVLKLHGPRPAAVHLQRGNELEAKGDVGGAIAEYREAIRLEPGLAEAHNCLGSAYRAEGDPDNAMIEYRAALRLQPDLPDAHNNLGVALKLYFPHFH